MADHGTVEYATATGNDYPAHEGTYERFVLFAFVGIVHVINLLFGLAVGGVMGHWLWALPIFFLAIVGVVSGLLSGSKGCRGNDVIRAHRGGLNADCRGT
jgi:hypothetical protein